MAVMSNLEDSRKGSKGLESQEAFMKLARSNQRLEWNEYHLVFPREKGDRDGPKKSPTQISLTLFGHQDGYKLLNPCSENAYSVFKSLGIPTSVNRECVNRERRPE